MKQIRIRSVLSGVTLALSSLALLTAHCLLLTVVSAAEIKISELPAATEVTNDDLFVIVDSPGSSPVTKKITAQNVFGSIGSIVDSVTFTDPSDATKAARLDAGNQGAGQTGVIQAPVNGTAVLQAGTMMPTSQTFTQCVTIKDPTDASDYLVYYGGVASTITATHCIITGSTNIVGQFDICNADGASCAAVDSSDMTCTTTKSNDTSLGGTTAITAGYSVKWRSTSASGTPTSLLACFDYTMP